tara:strand:+ start:419 stop:607 length:189 start_codon:yes stop_codon:yes gene_type:complete
MHNSGVMDIETATRKQLLAKIKKSNSTLLLGDVKDIAIRKDWQDVASAASAKLEKVYDLQWG